MVLFLDYMAEPVCPSTRANVEAVHDSWMKTYLTQKQLLLQIKESWHGALAVRVFIRMSLIFRHHTLPA